MNISLEEINDTLPLLNDSTDFKLNSLHTYLYGRLPTKMAYFFMMFITYIVGPMLVSGIIIFEKYGGDPQKRNLINRLLSMALMNQIMLSVLVGVCRVCREMFGLIDFNIMLWIESFGYILLTNFILFMNQMTILQYLYIIVWKRVRMIDDGFWALFLCMLTVCWSCCFAMTDHIPNRMCIHVFKMITANLPEPFENIR